MGGSKSGEPSNILREQDRFLPIANVARIMKRGIPPNGKVSSPTPIGRPALNSLPAQPIRHERGFRRRIYDSRVSFVQMQYWIYDPIGFHVKDRYLITFQFSYLRFHAANAWYQNDHINILGLTTSKCMHGMNQTETVYSRHGKRSHRASLSQIGPVVMEV